METHKCVVDYQIATYSGKVEVECDEDDGNDVVIAKARERLRRESCGSLPFGCESFNVESRRPI